MILEPKAVLYKCPSCGAVEQGSPQQYPGHACPALRGLTVPFVAVTDEDDKPAARHVVVQREDGAGAASVRTERPDGSNDCIVFAPTATVAGDAH